MELYASELLEHVAETLDETESNAKSVLAELIVLFIHDLPFKISSFEDAKENLVKLELIEIIARNYHIFDFVINEPNLKISDRIKGQKEIFAAELEHFSVPPPFGYDHEDEKNPI